MNSGYSRRSSTPSEAKQIAEILLRYHQQDWNPATAQPRPGGCEWILNHPNYRRWREDMSSGILSITGPPRSGKSVLLSFILHDLERARPKPPDTILLSYSIQNAVPKPTSEIMILRSFIWQILSDKPNLMRHVLPLFRSFGPCIFLSCDLLWEIFSAVMAEKSGHIWCFVDGLDYCEANVKSVVLSKFISQIVRLRAAGSHHSFKVATAARTDQLLVDTIARIPASHYISLPDPWRDSYRRIAFQVTSPLSVKSAFKSALKSPRTKVKISGKERRDVGGYIFENMEDSLWASLVFESALNMLGAIPPGTGVSMMIVDTVLRLPKRSTELAYHLLSGVPGSLLKEFQIAILWLVFASGQLNPTGLLIATKCYLGQQSLGDVESEVLFDYLQGHPLVDFTEHRVRLAHPSLQQELLEHLQSSSTEFNGSRVHLGLGRACLSYILSEEFNDPLSGLTTTDQSELDFFLSRHNFYRYAATNWHIHLKAVDDISDDLWKLIERVCRQDCLRSRTWVQVYLATLPTEVPSLSKLSALHIAALLDFKALVHRLVSKTITDTNPFAKASLMNAVGHGGRTALHWAAELGNSVAVKALVDFGTDTALLDDSGRSALERACWKGNSSTVGFLLEVMGNKKTVATARGAVEFSARPENVGKIKFLVECARSMRQTIPPQARLSFLEGAGSNDPEVVPLLLSPNSGLLAPRTGDGRSALHIASRVENVFMVRWLINAGANVGGQCLQGATAIHVAVKQRNIAILKLLLSTNRGVDLQDNSGQTALHRAVGWPHGVRSLLERDARPDIQDQDGNTPIHLSVIVGCMECFSLLLAKPCDQVHNLDGSTATDLAFVRERKDMLDVFIHKGLLPTKFNNNGQPLLHQACGEGAEGLVNLLLEKGADLNQKDKEGRTPLELLAWRQDKPLVKKMIRRGCDWKSVLIKAAVSGQHSIVSLLLTCAYGNLQDVLQEAWKRSVREDHFRVSTVLLAAGLGVEHKDSQGATLLWSAVACGATNIVQLLLQRGSNVNFYFNGMTALHKAVTNGNIAMMKGLLEAGANPNSRDERWGATPLYIAIQGGSVQPVRLLLRYKAKTDICTKYKTPLETAVGCGYANIVQLLLERGASTSKCKALVREAVSSNMLPMAQVLLHFSNLSHAEYEDLFWLAFVKQHLAVSQVLLDKGADVNARNKDGRTPLSCAAACGKEAMVGLLLEKGANMEYKDDNRGQTPLSWAAENGQEAVVRLLVEKGANVESKGNTHGRTPLSLAAENGRKAVVRLLVEKGAQMESSDDDGQTPVTRAARCGHEAVVRLLAEKGAELESRDNGGRTPLSWAAGNGCEVVVGLLVGNGANVESRDKDGQTPLSWAAGNGQNGTVEVLLEVGGANMESKDNALGQTPLSWAARNGREAVVRLLMEKGANMESKDNVFGWTPLFRAAKNGREAVVRLLVEKGANVEFKDNFSGQTPLSWAARKGQEAVVKLLVEREANIESTDNIGRTPLSWAAENGQEAVVRLLVENGANMESKGNTHGRTPLSLAAENGREAVVRLLVEKGANLESKDTGVGGRTPLRWAAAGGHESVVRLLVEKGAQMECSDDDGQTPLSRAARCGHEAVVRLLLEKGAELESMDSGGRTPLSWAAGNGCEVVVGLLVGNGANVESRDKDGQTPLSWAAGNGQNGTVEVLLEMGGANMESKDNALRQTPLSLAAKGGQEAVVSLLVEKGANVESKSSDGQTPLSWAARNGREAVVRLLMEKGADMESKDNVFGWTPLFCAAKNGREAVVRLLVEKGANVEFKDNLSGQTPLSWAAREGQEAVVKLLVEREANIESTDNIGRTPLSWAAGNGQEAVVRLLVKKGAMVECRDNWGQTALSWAAEEGQEAVARLLVEGGANVESKDSTSRTPLLYAAEKGHMAVVRVLVEKGANMESKDTVCGQTPLSWAAREGKEAVVKLLVENGANMESKGGILSQTPLSYAAEMGHEAVVRLLVEKGANMESKDKMDQTPLSWAAREGKEAVVKLLVENRANMESKGGILGQAQLSDAAEKRRKRHK